MPIFIKAKPGDIAENVVIGGDPERINALARMLKGARLVSSNRGFIVYTGKFDGRRVTLACHGIGQPSAAIAIEELIALGARKIIRLGTCGALEADIKIGDFVLAEGASYSHGGTITHYLDSTLHGISLAQTPDFELSRMLVDALNEKKIKCKHTNVYSSDSFFSLSVKKARELEKYGNGAIDMETATLFMLGKLKGIKTAALLVVSDNVVKHTALMTHKDLEKKVSIAAKTALEALAKAVE